MVAVESYASSGRISNSSTFLERWSLMSASPNNLQELTTPKSNIVRRVASLCALTEQLQLRLAQARRQVDKVTPVFLARAFADSASPKTPPTKRLKNYWSIFTVQFVRNRGTNFHES